MSDGGDPCATGNCPSPSSPHSALPPSDTYTVGVRGERRGASACHSENSPQALPPPGVSGPIPDAANAGGQWEEGEGEVDEGGGGGAAQGCGNVGGGGEVQRKGRRREGGLTRAFLLLGLLGWGGMGWDGVGGWGAGMGRCGMWFWKEIGPCLRGGLM